MLTLIFYPIVSFNWYRLCRAKNDPVARKFLWYGLVGLSGILGLVIMWLTPMPWKGFVAVLAGIPYLLGGKLQTNLILKKQAEKKSRRSNATPFVGLGSAGPAFQQAINPARRER